MKKTAAIFALLAIAALAEAQRFRGSGCWGQPPAPPVGGYVAPAPLTVRTLNGTMESIAQVQNGGWQWQATKGKGGGDLLLLWEGNLCHGGLWNDGHYYSYLQGEGRWAEIPDPIPSDAPALPSGWQGRLRPLIKPKTPMPSPPPVPAPPAPLVGPPEPKAFIADGQDGILTGVVPSKLAVAERIVVVGGDEVPGYGGEFRFIGNLEAAALIDDSAKPHLTAIFKEPAKRKQFLADLRGPELAQLVAMYRIQAYDADTPASQAMLAPYNLGLDERFRSSGVKIFTQPAQGADDTADVTAAIYAYAGPESLRVINPKYNPNNDPDPHKKPAPAPKQPDGGSPERRDHSWAWVVLGLLALWLRQANQPK